MKDSTVKAIVGMAGIVLIEMVALMQGIDGIMLGGAIAILAGIAGYSAHATIQEAKTSVKKSIG